IQLQNSPYFYVFRHCRASLVFKQTIVLLNLYLWKKQIKKGMSALPIPFSLFRFYNCDSSYQSIKKPLITVSKTRKFPNNIKSIDWKITLKKTNNPPRENP